MNKFANELDTTIFKNVTNAHTDADTDLTIKSVDIGQDYFRMKRKNEKKKTKTIQKDNLEWDFGILFSWFNL